MTEEELDFRIVLAIAKGRNIVYYRKIENRTRFQYIHVVRDYRKQIVALLQELPESPSKYDAMRDLFQKIINLIDPKVKSEETTGVIIELEKLLYNE